MIRYSIQITYKLYPNVDNYQQEFGIVTHLSMVEVYNEGEKGLELGDFKITKKMTSATHYKFLQRFDPTGIISGLLMTVTSVTARKNGKLLYTIIPKEF